MINIFSRETLEDRASRVSRNAKNFAWNGLSVRACTTPSEFLFPRNSHRTSNFAIHVQTYTRRTRARGSRVAPYLKRKPGGVPAEGQRMGTNTVLSCSQLITFLQGSSSSSLRSPPSGSLLSAKKRSRFRYPPALSRRLPKDDISPGPVTARSRALLFAMSTPRDRAAGQ